MSTTIPEPAHEPLAYPGERVEADTETGTVESRVERVDVTADYANGPQYIYVLECGRRVTDESLRC